MSVFQNRIFIFDLHNTLYDEVMEYAESMQAAIDVALQACAIDQDTLCQALAQGHAATGSDWDDDVWAHVSALKERPDFEALKRTLIEARFKASEEKTKAYAYTQTIQALHDLKGVGASLFLATEATANAAAHAARWLGLDGVVDAVYAWPYHKPFEGLRETNQKDFPENPVYRDMSLQKPHPYILASILLDVAKSEGTVPKETLLEDCFDLFKDDTIDTAPLKEKVEDGNRQALEAIKAIESSLVIKDTTFQSSLEAVRQRCFYVGDSFFKDGFLARNAGIPFIHAGYGKKTDDQERLKKAQALLYKVTGWDPFLLQLTQEAGALPCLTAQIKPYYTCEQSFQDFMDFYREAA